MTMSSDRILSSRIAHVALVILGILVCDSALSQASIDATPAVSAGEHAPVEVFQGPLWKHIDIPLYPFEEVRRDGEGWVKLGFMVDTAGKPFEITVLDSTGNKDFERAAIGALRFSTFVPGSLNGKPTESGSAFTYKFVEESPALGAEPDFTDAYKSLLKAVAAKDKAAADAAISKLKITNLYEDAFFGLARYNYARIWGTDAEQLAGLRRATENSGNGTYYLPRTVFLSALSSQFDLEIKTHEYAEAIATWKRLQKMGIDTEAEAKIKPVIDQLDTLRSDDEEYGVSGVMPDGSWSLRLFKRRFHIEVAEGYISQVKLRCDKGYLYFAFDPKLRYEVNGKYGSCWMELLGAPGAKFTLFQF
jgi:TonB family protein